MNVFRGGFGTMEDSDSECVEVTFVVLSTSERNFGILNEEQREAVTVERPVNQLNHDGILPMDIHKQERG